MPRNSSNIGVSCGGIGWTLIVQQSTVAAQRGQVDHVVPARAEERGRGFGDPHPATLPSGRDVWHQPYGADELLPFRPEVKDLGQTFLPDPPHGWNDGHAAWNDGRFDQWVPNKGVTAMTYHTRQDLPYHYALADAFTVCDSYHCSLMGPTDPNRYHMWSGWVGNDGKGGGPVITNAEAGYDWSTYPERLERNGISWKIYQDVGTGLNAAGSWGWTNDPYIGNYGDNSLLYFHQYQNAQPGTPLADKAKTGTEVRTQGRDPEALLADFRADVEAGRLPQVSWITAPEAYTEHPNWEPAYGSWYISQVIDILAAHPEVWSKMALFITYDEEGGFFDHVVPPTPPQTREHGLSTVPTTNEIFPGDADHPAGPYGLGIRVPMIIVSPWTRGGYVNSQVFDHTSLIKFLEARFGHGRPDLTEKNITPWRRAVVGDLTSAFDFRHPNRSREVTLPDTDDFKPDDLVRHPDEVPVPPADQRLPKQERGVRPARAIPYTLHADGHLDGGVLRIDFRNSGGAGAVFQVRRAGSTDTPRSYTVEPGRHLTDTWEVGSDYDLSVHGPNGFFRRFASGRSHLDVTPSYDERGGKVTLTLTNRGSKKVEVTVRDGYNSRPVKVSLRPGATERATWALARTHGWYDLTVGVAGDADFAYHCAGHVENGRDSISDPALGGLV
ncbi:phospholipase C, phosphocholine-specific [Micromonospora sp. WMMD710]|uniref:phosphocholine-specific phospholipase C n=1 Tax=Micromonospora sp. WMMD710 TaxID=3016085 RepID=UPI0024162653|nr:phospholipase C, phosphocholine-specific [Micromonospora sp. WMMD710]MDG4757499.1 phospholipase C, phosphocholine-specific [Micromonospora sp. WMMD710]